MKFIWTKNAGSFCDDDHTPHRKTRVRASTGQGGGNRRSGAHNVPLHECHLMSALVQKQTSERRRSMSAIPAKADMVQHGRWCVNVQPPGGKLTAVMSTVVLIGRLVRKLIALRLERDRSEQPLN